ncbi:polysaccharide deacetylase family protein [Streptacidiphilus melanogenes]|uniref:polysaccharide deacetylase family protein n=1 Tax=Streptacidiphilus melanogenes TaxID=411235 RepID=UPI0005A979AE|nr:polysaccharide deacetylase family protein [Streptacidiphilus melanogenes]
MSGQSTSDHATPGRVTARSDVPVLMYHSVRADPPSATRTLSVHPDRFAAQLDALLELGLTPVPFGALVAHWRTGAGLPARPVVLTFDDGYADFHAEVLPRLVERGLTASLFVTTGWLADAAPADRAGAPLDATLCWSQLKEIEAAGIETGGHSHSHAALDAVRPGVLGDELARCRDLLEDRLGRAEQVFCYPFGYSDARVRTAVRSRGWAGACAVANTLARPAQGPYALARLTVRRRTELSTFRRLVQGVGVTRHYLADRALTKGYAVVRRTRTSLVPVRTWERDRP